MNYHWYRCTQPDRPTDYDKLVGGLYGYIKEPENETIEKYDLRKVSYGIFDELCEKYF